MGSGSKALQLEAVPWRDGSSPVSLLKNFSWRYLISPPQDGPENMAWDEALVEHSRQTGQAVLRIYTWSGPTLSLGRNQRARGTYDPDAASRLGVGVVRRPTGGRALLHWHEITYAAAAPLLPGMTPRAWYAAVNVLLLRALRSLEVPATLAAAAERLTPPGSIPCFERPVEGEVVVSGRKLVGSALRASGGYVLQHGSILVRDDQQLLQHLAQVPLGALRAAATLHEALGREPWPEEVAAALLEALHHYAGGAEPLQPDPHLLAWVRAAQRRYADPQWTWRL